MPFDYGVPTIDIVNVSGRIVHNMKKGDNCPYFMDKKIESEFCKNCEEKEDCIIKEAVIDGTDYIKPFVEESDTDHDNEDEANKVYDDKEEDNSDKISDEEQENKKVLSTEDNEVD